MKKKTGLFRERGQALVLIAIASIALFAIIGLVIDGSAAFSDRRHAQNAADTAALAGALAKVKGDPYWDLAAVDRAGANGYGDLVGSTVVVNNPPASGIYSNCADVHFTCTDYVQVIITTNLKTTFASIFGINQLHNRVEAVASTITANDHYNFGGNSVVALSSSGCALVAGGTTNVDINGGGMFSNSDSSCAFKKNSCAGTVDIDGGSGTITTVGGDELNTGCLPSANLSTGAKQVAFPPVYEQLATPTECSQTADLAANYNVTGSGPTRTATLQPGHYSQLPVNNNWKDMILNPGVYCIDTTLSVSSTGSLSIASGNTAGVLLYFKAGGSFTINGGATVNIWGINTNNTSTPSEYQGFLMYVAPNYSLSTPPTCKINGGSTSTYAGTIYAPYCNLQLNGGSGMTMNSQLVGYTVDMTGASGVTLNYTAGDNATYNIPLQVGLSK